MKIISVRQIIKEAGPKERKRAGGINFEHVRSNLSSGGEEVPRSAIDSALLDERNLLISGELLNSINDLNLSEDARKRVNSDEAFLIIAGAVLSSDGRGEAEGKITVFNWYLVTKELSPGSFGITPQQTLDVEEIKNIFNREFEKVKVEKEASEREAEKAKSGGYISNDIVYDFGDGWKVVYIPATGEIKEYPGLRNTSHDRILEGNKNGLCLGSGNQMYQDNASGKVYSVRDGANKPRVTIRIDNNKLEEAKGRNNNPPDTEGAAHANSWFESLKDLDYKDSGDFNSFPPLNIEKAKGLFDESPDEAYEKGWVAHWYGRGISRLDKDVEERFEIYDPSIIKSGFGKFPQFFKKTLPVVQYWCKKYLEENSLDARGILFGEGYWNPPTHEIFKTYKKEDLMRSAVEKLSKESPTYYFELGLQEIPEYNEFSSLPIKAYIEDNAVDFINRFSDKEWAKPYLGMARDRIAEEAKLNPRVFIKDYSRMGWVKPYLGIAAESLAKSDPEEIIFMSLKEEWVKPYLGVAAENLAKEKSLYFLEEYSDKKWAKPYLDLAIRTLAEKSPENLLLYHTRREWGDLATPYLGIAAEKFSEENEYGFLSDYSDELWALPYVDSAAKRLAERNGTTFLNHSVEWWAKPYLDIALEDAAKTFPDVLLRYYSNRDWANKPVAKLDGKSWIDYAREVTQNKTASNKIYDLKLARLSRSLRSFGLRKEAENILKLK